VGWQRLQPSIWPSPAPLVTMLLLRRRDRAVTAIYRADRPDSTARALWLACTAQVGTMRPAPATTDRWDASEGCITVSTMMSGRVTTTSAPLSDPGMLAHRDSHESDLCYGCRQQMATAPPTFLKRVRDEAARDAYTVVFGIATDTQCSERWRRELRGIKGHSRTGLPHSGITTTNPDNAICRLQFL